MIFPPEPPLFTDAEKDMLRPIIVNAYRNMNLEQQRNLNNQWANINININNVPNIQNILIKRFPSGYPDYNIVIKRPGDMRSDVLFNTIDIPQQTRRGGKKSRRIRKKSRKTIRKTRKSRKHR